MIARASGGIILRTIRRVFLAGIFKLFKQVLKLSERSTPSLIAVAALLLLAAVPPAEKRNQTTEEQQ
jgi:hypothetical protein